MDSQLQTILFILGCLAVLIATLRLVMKGENSHANDVSPRKLKSTASPMHKETTGEAHSSQAIAQSGKNAGLNAKVLALLDKNAKIQAIKLVRLATGLGLRDAALYVEKLEQAEIPSTVDQLAYREEASEPVLSDIDEQLRHKLQNLVNQDQKINAIKILRKATGMGLKEVKDYVDKME